MPKFRIESNWDIDTVHIIEAANEEEAWEVWEETAELNWRTIDRADYNYKTIKELNA